MDFLPDLQVLWDYLCLGQTPQKADCIVGFGNFNVNIAKRAAELYHQGLAERVLFTGGLGRNTLGILPEPEAVRFGRVAMEAGVPESAILIEDQSTNTAENILFTRKMLEQQGISGENLLGVHQPFMERRIRAAFGVYWPECRLQVTSPQVTIPEYLEDAVAQGVSKQAAIEVIVGDFQRMDLYAKKGYQVPQEIPDTAWQAFDRLVAMGYGGQLARD